jgi:hypothetical protein
VLSRRHQSERDGVETLKRVLTDRFSNSVRIDIDTVVVKALRDLDSPQVHLWTTLIRFDSGQDSSGAAPTASTVSSTKAVTLSLRPWERWRFEARTWNCLDLLHSLVGRLTMSDVHVKLRGHLPIDVGLVSREPSSSAAQHGVRSG